MKMQLLKNVLLIVVISVFVIFSGCGNSVCYDIPNDAIAISDRNENTYINPNDSEDSYSYVEIDGVTYIPYGTQGKTITSEEVGSCIAYNEADSNDRFYKVNGNNDFIANYYVGSEMEQFGFWRRVDTIGKEIDIPNFIDDLGYEIWK
jgi:hypothetical protein